jgi:hypothetical protein
VLLGLLTCPLAEQTHNVASRLVLAQATLTGWRQGGDVYDTAVDTGRPRLLHVGKRDVLLWQWMWGPGNMPQGRELCWLQYEQKAGLTSRCIKDHTVPDLTADCRGGLCVTQVATPDAPESEADGSRWFSLLLYLDHGVTKTAVIGFRADEGGFQLWDESRVLAQKLGLDLGD